MFTLAGGIFLAFWLGEKMQNELITVAILATTVIMVLLPIEGFKDRVCKVAVELMRLERGEDSEEIYYVEKMGVKVIFAYDNSKQYDLDGGAYEEKQLSGKIKIYESKDCLTPILKIFVIKPSRILLTFAPFSTKKEYIFYVPKGTVLKQKK